MAALQRVFRGPCGRCMLHEGEAYPALRSVPTQGPNERICNAGAPEGVQGGLPCTPGRQECADICPSLQHSRLGDIGKLHTPGLAEHLEAAAALQQLSW